MRKKVMVALKMAGVAGQDKLSGIFRYLQKRHDWDIRLVRTAIELTPERVRTAILDRYDGFIVSLPGAENSVAQLAETDIPTVVMDIDAPNLGERSRNIAFVSGSDEAIGTAAADHLISIGTCRSYAFVHVPGTPSWSKARFTHFRNRLRAKGLSCRELSDIRDLTGLDRPVGVMAANDDVSCDVLEYCRDHRLSVPRKIAIIGVDNDSLICENSHPKLSSVQPDFEQEGFISARTLGLMLEEPQTEPIRITAGIKGVFRRESTAEESYAGKLVQTAIAYIDKHATEGITVDDVARHLKVSRRLAYLRFQELQGQSIGEAITAVKLAKVKRLLRTTDESIDAIAARCGYTNVNYLRNLFKRRFSMSMREFRKS